MELLILVSLIVAVPILLMLLFKGGLGHVIGSIMYKPWEVIPASIVLITLFCLPASTISANAIELAIIFFIAVIIGMIFLRLFPTQKRRRIFTSSFLWIPINSIFIILIFSILGAGELTLFAIGIGSLAMFFRRLLWTLFPKLFSRPYYFKDVGDLQETELVAGLIVYSILIACLFLFAFLEEEQRVNFIFMIISGGPIILFFATVFLLAIVFFLDNIIINMKRVNGSYLYEEQRNKNEKYLYSRMQTKKREYEEAEQIYQNAKKEHASWKKVEERRAEYKNDD